MTTESAMMERRASYELEILRKHNMDLLAKVEELKRADDYSRKAINQLLKTLEEKREAERSKRVEAEREACARMIEAFAEGGWNKRKNAAEYSSLTAVAEMIRARSSETSSTVED
jgi:hypothetical protein